MHPEGPEFGNRPERSGVERCMRYTLKYVAIFSVLAIGLTACGLAEAATPETTQPGTIAEGEPAPGTNPSTGMCLPDAPDCGDVVISPTDGNRCMPEFPDCIDTGAPEPIVYVPVDVEGRQAGDGHVIGSGELISTNGSTITVGFWMGTGDCFAVERIDLAETDTKVAVDITVAPRAADQVCVEIAEARSVTVDLDQPLGLRILEVGGAPVSG